MIDGERNIKSQMKIGAGIALFGLLCPFFWISLFSGNSVYETWVYGVHSSFFIAIGFALLGMGWYDLKHIRTPVQIKN